jgi:hypothetical protein
LIDSLLEETWCKEICNFLAMLKTDPGYFRCVSGNARKFDWEATLQPIIRLVKEA